MADEKEITKDSAEKSSSSMKLIIIGVILLIVIPVIGFFVASKIMFSGKSEEGEAPVKETTEIGTIIPMSVIVVNVANTNGSRYLRVGVSFEVAEPTLQEEIEKRNPQIMDTLIMILTNKDLEDLVELTGKKQIRTEIKEKINAILTTGKIKNVYFTEFVIQ